MASGRIQPGSRQWVEAMRRLSGTEDPTVDMSMGRKVSRDAAIPHRMGSEALDTRLRGGGEPSELLFEVVSTVITGKVTFRVSGGRAPYVFDPLDRSETRVIPAPGEFSHDYDGPEDWSGRRDAEITDADDQTAYVSASFHVPLPSVWVPVSLALLEQDPVVNGPFRMDVFEFFNHAAPGVQLMRGLGNGNQLWQADETGLVIIFAGGPTVGMHVRFGTTERRIFYDRVTGLSWGFEITSPAMLPGEMQPSSLLQLEGSQTRTLRMPPSHGSHSSIPNLSVLNTVYGSLGQTGPWPEGVGLTTTGDPWGPSNQLAHWNGTEWANGRAPALPDPLTATVEFVAPAGTFVVMVEGGIPPYMFTPHPPSFFDEDTQDDPVFTAFSEPVSFADYEVRISDSSDQSFTLSMVGPGQEFPPGWQPPVPFEFVAASLSVTADGVREGMVEVRGGIPPYRLWQGDGLLPQQTFETGLITWTDAPEGPFDIEIRDSTPGMKTLQVEADYTGMEPDDEREIEALPFSFVVGNITTSTGLRGGWVRLRGGFTPLTSDAPADWEVRISSGSREPSWSNFAMPMGPLFMTFTDPKGETVSVTFDYTGLETNQQRPVTEVP